VTTSEKSIRQRSDLFQYQEAAVKRIVDRRQQAVLLKVGLGKTVITLTALIDMNVAGPILLFAPAKVVELDVWGREARGWKHTRKIRVVPVRGPELKRKRIIKENWDDDTILAFSYETMEWFCQTFPVKARTAGAIVFDELSKMKSPGVKRFRAARHYLNTIPIRIGLTGTPVGNHLFDIWGELYTVAGELPLGPTFTKFRDQYFYPIDYNKWKWVPHPKSAERINERIRPFAFTIPPHETPVKQVEVIENEIEVELPPEVKGACDQLTRELITRLESGEELQILSKSALAGKLRQMASGAVFLALEPGQKKPEWREVHDAKLQAVDEILEEQQGEPVLLYYHYTHELVRLLRRYPQARLLEGPAERLCTQDEWNAGRVELLVAHPQSVGFGLNLQQGGSTIVWLNLPWSVELYEQATGRLARQGQRADLVTSHIILAGTADKVVLQVLRAKGKVQAETLEALSA